MDNPQNIGQETPLAPEQAMGDMSEPVVAGGGSLKVN
jgi:hypothetical protein